MPRRLIPKSEVEWIWLGRSVVLISITWALVIGVALVVGLKWEETRREEETDRNRQLITIICRQNNELRTEFLLTLLDRGVPFHRLERLRPVNCNSAALRREE